jgi:phage terminase small subunit
MTDQDASDIRPTPKQKKTKAKKKSKGELTLKQQAFVNAYFGCGMNATQAYLDLYPESSYNSANANSARMIARDSIAAAISKRLKEKAMGVDELIARYGEMARADTLPFVRVTKEGFVYFNFNDPRAKAHMFLIKEIESKRTRRVEGVDEWEDEWVKVKLHDAQHAMDQIGKLHKLFIDRYEVEGKLSVIGIDDILTRAYGNGNNNS